MVQNGPEWSRWSRKVQNGLDGPNGPEWSRIVQNSPEWSRMFKNGPKMHYPESYTNIGDFCPKTFGLFFIFICILHMIGRGAKPWFILVMHSSYGFLAKPIIGGAKSIFI